MLSGRSAHGGVRLRPMEEALAQPRASKPGAAWSARFGGTGRTLLRLPLFLKVLVANCVLVLLGAVVGTWFTLTYVAGPNDEVHWAAVAVMLVAGFAGSVLINAGVLTLALQPLRALERTVDGVAAGDLSIRVQPVLFTDPDVERLGEMMNVVLDVLQDYRAQVQKLSGQVLAAQEDERKRISRELHDETAQSLTTLLIRLKMLERARNQTELSGQIRDLRELTVETLEAVRKLAIELRPSTLDDLGLLAALEAYTESYSARMPLAVDFAATGFDEEERLPPQVELVLYRVVQEALTNAAKHAAARKVRVTLDRGAYEVVATVQDDGRGFDADDTLRSKERGLGLFGMQERMALVRGRLSIHSAPGVGTEIVARVPLESPVPLRGEAW